MIHTLAFFLSSLLTSHAFAGQIAFAFDDAPRGDEVIYSGEQRTEKIIEVLRKHQIETVFFVNTDKFEKDKGTERITAYSKAGHFIANHTHSHLRLGTTPTSIFKTDIDKADQILKSFPTFVKWFRFPFLYEGSTIQIRDEIRSHLKQTGYRNGYVTVDNYDYFINDLVQKALKKGQKVHLDRACRMLVDLMWAGILYYDEIAKKHIGSVRHVLLMHENDIEAHCLDPLISHIKNSKWEIISPKVAFEDPLLKEEPDTIYLNQGRIAAIAHLKTGIEYRSKWEDTKALKDEFEKRRIVEIEK